MNHLILNEIVSVKNLAMSAVKRIAVLETKTQNMQATMVRVVSF